MIRRSAASPLMLALATASAMVTLAIGFWIPVKAQVAQILLERAWDATRAGLDDARPWPWADTTPVARLAIPSLDVSWVVLLGASGRNLAFAPSLLDGSALPGETGVTIISGHRDTHFAALEYLQIGQELRLEDARGKSHAYRIFEMTVIDSTRAGIRLDATAPTLVLTTCYPFDALTAGGPLRYVVQAVSIPVDAQPN